MVKSIVIVGAGPGGQKLAQALKKDGKDCKITILSAIRFAEFAPMSCYFTANAEQYHKYSGPQDMDEHDKFQKDMKGIKIIYGEATSVDPDGCCVKFRDASGQTCELTYDLLVAASGVDFGPVLSPRPLMSVQERFADVQLVTSTLDKAKKVVVIGGGPIAVKVAGDYKERNPNAEVVMACRSKLTIKNWNGQEDTKLRELLSEARILVKEGLGDVKSMPKTLAECCRRASIEFTNGQTLEADLVVPGFQTGFNSSYLPAELLSQEKPTVSTNNYGQSDKRSNIFAIGALSSIEKDFMGIPHYDDSISMYSANIVSVLSGMQPTKDLTSRTTFKKHKAPFNIAIGHATYGLIAERHAPMGEGFLFQACGFPCTLLCPCLWPCPFMCGYCCQSLPSGRGRGFGPIFMSTGATYKEAQPPAQAKMALTTQAVPE